METTYTALRAELATFLDKVTDDREPLIVRRRGARDIAIIPADELSSLLETAHLLRSSRNAERLLQSLVRSKANDRKGSKGRNAARAMAALRDSIGRESSATARK